MESACLKHRQTLSANTITTCTQKAVHLQTPNALEMSPSPLVVSRPKAQNRWRRMMVSFKKNQIDPRTQCKYAGRAAIDAGNNRKQRCEGTTNVCAKLHNAGGAVVGIENKKRCGNARDTNILRQASVFWWCCHRLWKQTYQTR